MVLLEFLYLIGVKAYGLGIWTFSLFNKKASLWITGRRTNFSDIKNSLQAGEKRIWFHCPSLGEYEQGRPVLEAIRKEYPSHKIVLTFFSPSGYEIKKKDPLADYVFYMPLDGPGNSLHFINLVTPEMAFFVKYDFWHYYIRILKEKQIPSYFISCIFRPSQVYFKWYGIFFDRILRRVTHFFVQNQESLELLYLQGIPSVTVTGDTRFDRVYENSLTPREFPLIRKFKATNQLLVAGSIWPSDEEIIIACILETRPDLKWILVPHEIHEETLDKLESKLNNTAIRYSKVNADTNLAPFRVLIIDNMGMLSGLYALSEISYIGGGFGAGIHNILESAVYGTPVLFGPNYKRFQEARDLVSSGGAFRVENSKGFKKQVEYLLDQPQERERIKNINLKYIEDHLGATKIIMSFLRMNH